MEAPRKRMKSSTPCPSTSRFRVLLKARGMTQPYSDGTPREIWPDGRFLGYPIPDAPLQPDNQDGYKFNSMPMLWLLVTPLSPSSDKKRMKALFLIDSGAVSVAQWSLHLKDKVLELRGEEEELTLRLENDIVDMQLEGFEDVGRAQTPNPEWRVEYRAKMRVKKDTMGIQPSPRENSVLGLPWMADVKPLFEFEGVIPSPEQRLAILFPANGKKGYFKVALRDPHTGKKLIVPVAIDTGAPFSTFPETYVEPLDLAPAETASYPQGRKRIFNWFDFDQRVLYDVEFCEQDGAGVQWCLRNAPVGLTARKSGWGLLGMDFLLAVKPLIVYEGAEALQNQVEGVDYLKRNLMQDIGEKQAKALAREVLTRRTD